jgi:hypothetical protein
MTYLPNSNASPDPTHGSMLAAFEVVRALCNGH